jgi:hypothetical protein
MRELSHCDHIPKQLKSQRSTRKNSMWTSPKLFHNVDVVEAGDFMQRPVTRQMMQALTNTVLTCGSWLV